MFSLIDNSFLWVWKKLNDSKYIGDLASIHFSESTGAWPGHQHDQRWHSPTLRSSWPAPQGMHAVWHNTIMKGSRSASGHLMNQCERLASWLTCLVTLLRAPMSALQERLEQSAQPLHVLGPVQVVFRSWRVTPMRFLRIRSFHTRNVSYLYNRSCDVWNCQRLS